MKTALDLQLKYIEDKLDSVGLFFSKNFKNAKVSACHKQQHHK